MAPFAHTFSIIARDPDTGQLGIGVQSHWFAVGSVVPWAEADVGAVASQAMADVTYGRLGLDLMRAGKTAEQALAGLVASDPNNDIRQVAMIDNSGKVAVYTGKRCVEFAGHASGEQFSTQGNMLANKWVWTAMAEAYLKAKGDFSERLLQTLEAGQDAGGDVRGKQSAALLVVPGPDDPLDRPTITDLRVDDSRHPLLDLRRLLTVQRGYEWHAQAIHSIEMGDLTTARKHYTNLRGLAVGTREPQFWYAAALVEAGHVEEALPIFAEVFKVEPVWRDLINRLVKVDMFTKDEKILEKIKALPADGDEKPAAEKVTAGQGT